MAKPYAETKQVPATAPCVNAMPNSLVNMSVQKMSLMSSTTCSGRPPITIQCGTQRTIHLLAQLEELALMTHSAVKMTQRNVAVTVTWSEIMNRANHFRFPISGFE